MTKLIDPRMGISMLVALAALACADQSAKRQPPQRAQFDRSVAGSDGRSAAEPLSPVVSSILRERMVSHARDMNQLVSAIMVLDYPSIEQRASAIAADVNLSRPVTSDASELNALLPERFFRRQDELKASAKGLVVAANALDPYSVADAYGRLSEGCVRCHADYRPRRAATLPPSPSASAPARLGTNVP